MADHVDVLLLLALPASGKSEVRRYLASLNPEQCQQQFGLSHTVQLDDFPYVHIMRRVSNELTDRGHAGLFSLSDVLPFRDPIEWLTLIELINEDYADLQNCHRPTPESAALWLFDRIDAARQRAGGAPLISSLAADLRQEIAQSIEAEALDLLRNKVAEVPDSLTDKTIVIEFARGCADGQDFPFPYPYGYQASLAQLNDDILERSSILYIWVEPAESRRKNTARTDPNDPGSILHHGVPLAVMYGDYGVCDLKYLIEQSAQPNTVAVQKQNRTFVLPVGCFDNRSDRTSFIRQEQSQWSDAATAALVDGLGDAFDQLATGAKVR